MDVVFFKKNISYAKEYIRTKPDSVAFWYTPGLSSYKQLDKILNADNLILEEGIASDFLKSSPQYNSVPLSIFPDGETRSNFERRKMCFFASNDTHIYLFATLISYYADSEYDLYCRRGESAFEAAKRLDLKVAGDNIACKQRFSEYSVLVMGNDWGLIEQDISNTYISNGINSTCLQESILDLNVKDNRLRFCSLPVFQGLNSLNSVALPGLIGSVIGNPRFESLSVADVIHEKKVFVNVNFTYGIFEDIREKWLSDILEICSELDADYILSQHPRDNADLSKYKVLKSHAGVVHQTIKESKVVISRFSALLLESISLGRPAIYYNPHGEEMEYRFDPDNRTLFLATDRKSLKNALEKVLNPNFTMEEDLSLLNFHLGVQKPLFASKLIKEFISDLKAFEPIKKISLIDHLRVRYKILKCILLGRKY